MMTLMKRLKLMDQISNRDQVLSPTMQDLIREYRAAAEILSRLSSDENIEALGQTIRDSDRWLDRNGVEK